MNKYQRTSIVAGQLGQEIIAPLQNSGTVNEDFFEIWFEEHLLPKVPQDAVIILDNASFHRKKRLFDIADKYPSYSPELNPIEHFWHWLKKTVTDTLRFICDLAYSIFTAFNML